MKRKKIIARGNKGKRKKLSDEKGKRKCKERVNKNKWIKKRLRGNEEIMEEGKTEWKIGEKKWRDEPKKIRGKRLKI